jgi:hypothetical protein
VIDPIATKTEQFAEKQEETKVHGWIGKVAGDNLNSSLVIDDYKAMIIDRLNKKGIDGESFCEQLVNHKCLLVGSFPLQCLLNEEYSGSQIDVFILTPIIFCEKKSLKMTPFDYYLYYNYNCAPISINCQIKCADGCLRYNVNKDTYIDVIQINAANLFSYIQTMCDLSFCRTYFDGDRLIYTASTFNKRGYIVNPYSYSTHSSSSSSSVCSGSNLKNRVEKYRQRGFQITCADFLLNENKITNIDQKCDNYVCQTEIKAPIIETETLLVKQESPIDSNTLDPTPVMYSKYLVFDEKEQMMKVELKPI